MDGPGQFEMTLVARQMDGVGTHHLRIATQIDGPGTSHLRRAVQNDGAGLHAIKATATKYHLWYNLGSAPDLTAAADETFASLPFTSLALTGEGVWHFVVRELNTFGLYSQNINTYTIELDGSDDELLERPSDPDVSAIAASATGGATVTAEYNYIKDGHGLTGNNDKSAASFLIFKNGGRFRPRPGARYADRGSNAKE